MKVWKSEAPANIALIKYMGKVEGTSNRPTNSSFSYTLDHLKSYVELSLTDGDDSWSSMTGNRFLHLSEKGQARFLRHLKFLKDAFQYEGSFHVTSGNGFPSDCGLASSASSFAALTKVACEALPELTGKKVSTLSEIADFSRQGSGSSCRSFFTPWCVWSAEGVRPVELPYQNLVHQVVVVDDHVKAVSSSEAHKRVTSSLLFKGRVERAELRLRDLIHALKNEKWSDAYEITWAEFWDMHVLFETARPSFGYMNADSLAVLRHVQREMWQKNGDGPLVTMDAGPNVHLLYRPEQLELAKEFQQALRQKYTIISSFDSRFGADE
jgi:diphosphomevalonate decarboxylase